MTFTDLETILRAAARRYAASDVIHDILIELAQDIRDFIEAEKADAEGKKS